MSTRTAADPFTQRHPMVSLAFLACVLLLIAIGAGVGAGTVGAYVIDSLTTS